MIEKSHIFPILLILITSIFMTAIIPPFQSPDEFDHVKRAYALSQGHFTMETPAKQSTGTEINSGLITYMSIYEKLPFKYENKFSSEDLAKAKLIKWSNEENFSPAPGVNYYFPMIYLPQAIGLSIGKLFNLTVGTSYFLARYFSIVTIFLILLFATNIYRINYPALGLLLIPMSIFQFSSASMDGIATALSVLILSIFMSAVNSKNITDKYFYTMTTCITLVVMCRLNLIPLLALPIYLSYKNNKLKHLIVTTLSFILIILWLTYGLSTTIDNRIFRNHSTVNIVLLYMSHPSELFDVVLNTLTNKEKLTFYWGSLLGIMGWLDHKLPESALIILSVALTTAIIASITTVQLKEQLNARLTLLLVGLSSIILILLILLATWNDYPADIIQGIQGRYFLIPLLIISYAISAFGTKLQPAALIAVLVIFITTIMVTPSTLLTRYYIASSSLKVTTVDDDNLNEGLCTLDEPQNNSSVKTSQTTLIRGWAFSNNYTTPQNVTVKIINLETGISLLIPTIRNERPDVAKAFNKEGVLMAGFTTTPLKPRSIPNGRYQVKIYQESEGKKTGCSQQYMLTFIE